MSGTKGIAVSQIILLVLGILVLAVVAYLLYSNFVTTGGAISAETCRAEATRECTGCSIASGGTATTCSFTPSTDSTKPTSLEKCQTQGNLRTTTTNVIDCTQYTGGGQQQCIKPEKTGLCKDGKKPSAAGCCEV